MEKTSKDFNRAYNDYKKAYLVIYRKNKTNPNSLEYLTISRNSSLSLIQADITSRTNTAPFAIADYMTNELKGIISKRVLKHIDRSKSPIPEYLLTLNPRWYLLPYEEVYIEWLRRLTDENPIQYDLAPGMIIYFTELDINTEIINQTKQIDLGFEYVSFGHIACKVGNIEKEILTRIDFCKFIAEQAGRQRDLYLLINCNPSHAHIDGAKGKFGIPCYFPGIYYGFLRRNNEEWRYYCPSNGEFPSNDEIARCKGLVIPGSYISPLSKYDYLDKLQSIIQQILKSESKRYLGICFGHQIGLKAMGYNPRKHNGFVNGVEKITLDEKKLSEFSFYRNFIKDSGPIDEKRSLSILQFHGYYIQSLSNRDFNTVGLSESCENEVTVSHRENYLGIQGHPDYSTEFILQQKIWQMVDHDEINDELYDRLREYHLAQYPENTDRDNKIWRGMIFSFLKS